MNISRKLSLNMQKKSVHVLSYRECTELFITRSSGGILPH